MKKDFFQYREQQQEANNNKLEFLFSLRNLKEPILKKLLNVNKEKYYLKLNMITHQSPIFLKILGKKIVAIVIIFGLVQSDDTTQLT